MASTTQDQAGGRAPDDVSQPDGAEPKTREDAPKGIDDVQHKPEKQEQKTQDSSSGQSEEKGPAGGYDSTPIPPPSPGTIGYTVKFTFHRATSLAIGDAHVMSSDPFCLAHLNTGLPMRHKEDPKLRFRTSTIRRNTDPEWNEEWIVANVPSTGFVLKTRIYDEDPADHDDRLGKIHINVSSLSDGWAGIQNQPYRLTVRDSSKRAVTIRAVATCFRIVEHFRGQLYMSIEVLGRTGDDGQNGRAYTVGQCRWFRHYSPLLGRLTHTKEPNEGDRVEKVQTSEGGEEKKQIQRYNFQANQLQLPGPIPAELYHRFVEFKPWVKRMFTTNGFQGVVLGKALHHQNAKVYNFDRKTVWGSFNEAPSIDMTKKFLELVHYDQGGRIYTYVLTLDALWRFTETGKEFGIDMLSKHTMHSDVSIYIAFSGEFFIRRLKHRHRPPPPDPIEGSSQQSPPRHDDNELEEVSEEDPTTDPSRYELIIDNDSGTYRPNAKLLPLLASFLGKALPGIHIQTLDCQADADKMGKMKSAQRERKKREGDNIIYSQDDASSISSSEGSRLDDIEARYQDDQGRDEHVSGEDRTGRQRDGLSQAARQAKMHQKDRMQKMQRVYGPSGIEGGSGASGSH